MKKLLLIAFMALVGLGAKAQIQLEEVYTNDFEIIGELIKSTAGTNLPPISGLSIYKRTFKDDVTYGFYIASTNRYDDNIEIALGHTEAEAAESIKILINFLENNAPNTSTTFTDLNGNKFQFSVYNKNFLDYKVLDYYIGRTFVPDSYPYIKKTILTKALELLGVEPELKQKTKKKK